MSGFDPDRRLTAGPDICECEHPACMHKGREVLAADHGSVFTSPALCVACLFCCTDDDTPMPIGAGHD